ncbi:hypothetical protein Desaci_3040 [Desulfosporosinus acidiphilus SJ4]|uniref:Helix-turn-helix domain-containing protein n=1 Tax=Desulfosporosinus acidiphilus (strain DSM 22704 / JCM 16185 / SJ4) TaxID=646529 RepID=I4D824_DESAJ|nr:hypothetical protein [Desulfosporosinus acidiphilus]AFM41948.1 hypothetical protein Desaci_3040 [Desulfosporosinus acidiphilus SJ4]
MARIRTIKQAVQSIKEQDPESCISEWWVRQLVKSGKLKCHMAGNRYLIDMDLLEDYLKNPPAEETGRKPLGILRKIEV